MTESIFQEVLTLEQARTFMLEKVAQVEEARYACNVSTTVKTQQKAYQRWLIKYGETLGSLTTLMHCRVLNDAAYEELRQRVMATMVPTVVDVLQR